MNKMIVMYVQAIVLYEIEAVEALHSMFDTGSIYPQYGTT